MGQGLGSLVGQFFGSQMVPILGSLVEQFLNSLSRQGLGSLTGRFLFRTGLTVWPKRSFPGLRFLLLFFFSVYFGV